MSHCDCENDAWCAECTSLNDLITERDALKAELEKYKDFTPVLQSDRDHWRACALVAKEALEKILELNEHPKSCLAMSANIPPLKCDCGVMLAEEALAAFPEEKKP